MRPKITHFLVIIPDQDIHSVEWKQILTHSEGKENKLLSLLEESKIEMGINGVYRVSLTDFEYIKGEMN